MTKEQQRRAVLKQLCAGIFDPLGQLSYVEAGSLFRSHLDDFASGVHFLVEILDELDPVRTARLADVDDLDEVHPHLKPTLRRLCELSREVTFSADPFRLPVEMRNAIERMFQFTVQQLPTLADKEAQGYLANMSDRTLEPIAMA